MLKINIGFTYVTLANVISAILGALFWLFFASTVPVDEYGQLNYVISVSSIMFGISVLGMDTTILTFVPKGIERVLHEGNTIVFIATIISAMLGAALFEPIVGFLIVGISFFYMSTIELLAKKKHKEFAVVAIGSKVAQIIASIALYYLIGFNGFILGYALAYLFFGYRFMLSLRQFSFKIADLKPLKRFSAESYGFNTSKTLMLHLDKILIASFFGYYELGAYQLAFQFFLLISLIPTSLFQYLLPNEANGTVTRRLKVVGVVLAAVVATSGIIGAPLLLPIFYPQFIQSIEAIMIISLAIIPLTFITIVSTKLLAESMTLQVLIGGIIYVVVQASLSLLLGTLFGINGLALSVVISLSSEFAFLVFARKGRIFS